MEIKANKDYCPIKTKDGMCGVGRECNHIGCWEKIHYRNPTNVIEQKMKKWEAHRRIDNRLNKNNKLI